MTAMETSGDALRHTNTYRIQSMAPFVCRSNAWFKIFGVNSFSRSSSRSITSTLVKTSVKAMPKDKSALLEKLRQNRISNANKKKKTAEKMPSNLFQLVVLGNGSRGNPRALYVNAEHNSYLFNCGEGTQRLANEHKLKLSKLQNIFFTKQCCENMSGLVGLLLTCQDMGVSSLTLHGPKNLDQLLSLYQHFLRFSGMEVKTKDYADFHFEDVDLVVKCFPVLESNREEEDNKTANNDSNLSFLYLCRLKTRPGELLIDKCIELKVPAGPLLGQLKAGQDVVLSDGRVIRAQDVTGNDEKGPIFIVLECPSVHAIDSLVANENVFENLSDEDFDQMSVIIHFTPSDVYYDPKYQGWVKRFGHSVKNLIINEDNPSEAFVSANGLQIKLNSIDPYIYPLLNCLVRQQQQEPNDPNDTNQCLKTSTLTKYHLRPKALKGLDLSSIANIDIEAFKTQYLMNSSFIQSLNQFRSFQNQLEDKTQDFPEVIFLGTGSAIPLKVRNTSAIWLNTDAETAFLMDCGEGTLGQLIRFYGNLCEQYLKKLKGIYISHLHADHHLGMLQIIKSRATLTSEPLILIIPPAVNSWLQQYNESVERVSDSYRVVMCNDFVNKIDPSVLDSLRLSQLRTTQVPHCSHSYAISLVTKSEPNFKIVYSGDTQPTPKLVEIGRDCDLLIHEATMEDQLVEEARLKFHSTTSEAIKMGVDMNAKFTILTHFSQRYAKIPVFNEQFNERVGIAFDNMRVRMSDLKKLPKMVDCLKCLFEQDINQMSAKTAHHVRRKEFLAQHYASINQ